MEKLLIISYHFPPDSAIGAVRPAKFAKYLPEFGWRPIIYTVDEKNYQSCDASKFEDLLRGVRIYRANPFPGILQLYSGIRSRGTPPATTQEGNAAKEEAGLPGFPKRLISSLLRVPDEHQGWIFSIAAQGRRILKEQGAGTFMTSGPPMSTHLGGLLLKKMTGACWIADFRDPWTTMQEWKGEAFRSDMALRIERWLERKTVSAADGIITTAPSVTRYFQSLLPQEERGKVITITNGYDNSDFQGLPQPEANPPGMRLTHAGSLYLGRNPEPLFGALRNLIGKGAIAKGEVRVDFIGDPHYRGAPLSAMVQEYDLAETVSLLGKMDFGDCFKRLLDSRGLLLLAQDQPQEIPGKVFEYLRLNKPTLVITDEGDTKDLLLDFPNFFLADPQKPGEIEEKLLETIRSMRSEGRTGPHDGITRYDRRALTARLCSWLSSRRSS
jgi:glycosyltransferase involved in cell wall biosynthesis